MAERRACSAGFRKRLRDEMALWQSEGLLQPDQARALSERYRLDDLAHESTGNLLAAIYIIGAILIGAGVISFVAAHWEGIPVFLKVALIVVAMVLCYGFGVHQWKISGARPRLGHALVILGTLVFGANIGLVAQIFQIHGDFYNGFGAWAVGAAALAYAAESMPVALIAVVTSFLWFCGGGHDRACWWYPLAAAAVFAPMIYLRRSVLLTLAALLAIGIATLVAVVPRFGHENSMLIAAAAVAGLYIAAGLRVMTREALRRVGGAALILGIVALATALYFLTFQHVTERWYGEELVWKEWYRGWILVGIALAGSVPLWVRVFMRLREAGPLRPAVLGLAVGLVGLVGAIGNGLAPDIMDLPDWGSGFTDVMAVVLANVGLLAVAAGLVWAGVAGLDRRYFWPGVLLVAMLILGRFLEYETSLLIKAAVFMACGVGLIVGGIRFESYLRRRRMAHDNAA